MYESVIAINPAHVNSYYGLVSGSNVLPYHFKISLFNVKILAFQASILRQGEQYILAEQALRDALAIDSTNCKVWRLLGEVLSTSESCIDPASKAMATAAFLSAIELEQTEPLEPFYTLRLGVYCS